MLIQFSVGNFLSFKDIVTFSMVASTRHRNEYEITHTFLVENKFRLLKSSVVYGANASGKTNLFNALRFIKHFVLNSVKDSQLDEIGVTNFKLGIDMDKIPSHFEVVFIQDGVRYRYGFDLDKTRIHREWLFYAPKGQEAKLFVRENNNFKIGDKFKEGKKLEDKTAKNALFLSVVAQFNGEISIRVIEWFKQINVISSIQETSYIHATFNQLNDPLFRKLVSQFLKIADLGIEDLKLEKIKVAPEDLPPEIRSQVKPGGEIINLNVKTLHKKYDSKGNDISLEEFTLNREESDGTKKLFALSGSLLDTLKTGKVLVIDELDARLHPKLTQFILGLFNSNEWNSSNAQLIFSSQSTNLLDKRFFRRDQIWFTEKNKFGATDLYSLAEYNVRKDASFGKDYLLGKYGAIPFVGEADFLFEDHNAE